MTFKDFEKRIRKLGLSRQEFANYAKIGCSTVNGWSMAGRRMPPWVAPFLELLEENRDYRAALRVIKKIKYEDIIKNLKSETYCQE